MSLHYFEVIMAINEITEKIFEKPLVSSSSDVAAASMAGTPGKPKMYGSPVQFEPGSFHAQVKDVIRDFSDEMVAKRCMPMQRIKLLLATLTQTTNRIAKEQPYQAIAIGKWQGALYDFLANKLESPIDPPAQKSSRFSIGSRAPKRNKVDSLQLKIDAVIAKLSAVNIDVKPTHERVEFAKEIISFPSKKSIAELQKPFNTFDLGDCFNDMSLLEAADEVILFGAIPLDSPSKIESEMRGGEHASAVQAFGVFQKQTPGKMPLQPSDIHTPEVAPEVAVGSPWRQAMARKAAKHIVLDSLVVKLMQLFALENIEIQMACRIASIILEHDKNPLLMAWQWIRFALEKETLLLLNRTRLESSEGLFYITTEKQPNGRINLLIQFTVNVTEIYQSGVGLVTAHDPLLNIALSCKICLTSFHIERRACSIVVNHPSFMETVRRSAAKMLSYFNDYRNEFYQRLENKNSKELAYFYPLELPIPDSLWREYLALTITPEKLLLHIFEHAANIGDYQKQAAKDYSRMVSVNGEDLPASCNTGDGKVDLNKVYLYIKSCFGSSWQTWQQKILDIFIAQQFFNPTESLWWQLITILDKDHNLQLSTAHGFDTTKRLYNLTFDAQGQFILTGGFQVFRITDKMDALMPPLASETPLISFRLQIKFPKAKDIPFTFDVMPKFTIHQACERYKDKIIRAFHTISCRKPHHFDSKDSMKIIESLRMECKIERVKHDEVRRDLFTDLFDGE